MLLGSFLGFGVSRNYTRQVLVVGGRRVNWRNLGLARLASFDWTAQDGFGLPVQILDGLAGGFGGDDCRFVIANRLLDFLDAFDLFSGRYVYGLFFRCGFCFLLSRVRRKL
jgi:hypothetical protein